jgi:hypothetical protein
LLQTESYGAIMETMRESWTDDRLDDLKKSLNERFDQNDARLDRIDVDIRDLRRMMVQGFIAVIIIMVTCFFSLAGLLVVL